MIPVYVIIQDWNITPHKRWYDIAIKCKLDIFSFSSAEFSSTINEHENLCSSMVTKGPLHSKRKSKAPSEGHVCPSVWDLTSAPKPLDIPFSATYGKLC